MGCPFSLATQERMKEKKVKEAAAWQLFFKM